MGTFGLLYWVIALAIVGFFLWIYARIARKAGFSGWWSLLVLVPLVNVVVIWIFAFTSWPAAANREKVAEIFD